LMPRRVKELAIYQRHSQRHIYISLFHGLRLFVLTSDEFQGKGRPERPRTDDQD
jgi:hypothetical protein